MAKDYEVMVESDGREFTVEGGTNLLEALQANGYEIPSPCGGMGLCGKCRVEVLAGEVPPSDPGEDFFSEGERDRGMRLACRAEVVSDLRLNLPSIGVDVGSGADHKAEMDERLEDVEPDSGIVRKLHDLEVPGREDQRSDATRLTDLLGEGVDIPLGVLEGLPGVLRAEGFSVTATVDEPSGKLLSVEPGDRRYESYGMAFDIGTTTVAGYGMDLDTGETLHVSSRENPQGKYGADVVSRIRYAREGDRGLEGLQEEVVEAVNGLVGEFADSEGVDPGHIYRATFVGNTIMLHLLAGVDPTQLDQAPYIPGFTDSQSLRAEELGIGIHPRGRVDLLPSLAGYVGADVTAGILHTGIHRSKELSLLVDIGTNGEMVLGNEERLIAASTAAGPAFEGANIEQGMTARPGAISHVTIDGEEGLDLEVMGGVGAAGICGSGIVDAVGELLKSGLVEGKGNLVEDPPPSYGALGDRVVDTDGERAFLLGGEEDPVFVTQGDVREVQLAKGAIRAGVDILLREFGAEPEDLDRVYLAGAFGNYLRKENVLRIGVLPRIDPDRVISVGNAAGQGAKLALINRGKQEELERLAGEVEYVELSFRNDFTDEFMAAMKFPV